MSKNNSGLDFDIELIPDFESMGYELAGTIEFYENPETKECAYRSLIWSTTMEDNLAPDKDFTEGQSLLMIVQEMLEEYITSERH